MALDLDEEEELDAPPPFHQNYDVDMSHKYTKAFETLVGLDLTEEELETAIKPVTLEESTYRAQRFRDKMQSMITEEVCAVCSCYTTATDSKVMKLEGKTKFITDG